MVKTVKKTKIRVNWQRTGRVTEKGSAFILVDDPNDPEELNAKIDREEFLRYLVKDRDYSELQTEYEVVNAPNTSSNDDAAG